MNERTERSVTIDGKEYEVVELDRAIKRFLIIGTIVVLAGMCLAAVLGAGVTSWV